MRPAPAGAPRRALVIGSGGVRSIAALGVADVLWREGLQPDLIVGCSAGALFGALLAMGHAVPQAVDIATTLWTAELTHTRRRGALAQMLMPRWFGFDAGFCLRDDRAIVERLSAAFGSRQIEDLPIALRITATDAATGQMVVLQRGPLVAALRASIAMPFMLPPRPWGGQRLIDGFVADPLPVAAADDAQAVVAVGFRAQLPSRIDGPSRLLAHLTSAMTNNLMDARLAAVQAGGPRVLALQPGLPRRVGLFETSAMPALVQAGRDLAELQLPAIEALLRAPRRLALA